MSKRLSILLMTFILVLSLPLQALAASSARLSQTAQASIEKLASQADSSLQAKLSEQSKQILELELQDQNLDKEIDSLHRANEAKQLAVKTGLKQFQAQKVDKLAKEAEEAKNRFKPLFAMQSSLNKQLAAARKQKNKALAEVLEAQLGAVKLSAALAREEIRMKNEALTKARKASSKTSNAVRAVLEEAALEQARMRTEKKGATAAGKDITAEGKRLNAALRSKDAAETLRSLASLATLSSQLVSHKTRISKSEQKISAILERASSLLPSS